MFAPTTAFLLLTLAAAGEPDWIGVATMATGDTVVLRQGEAYQLQPGAGILPGDQVTTSSGRASIVLGDAALVYLAPESSGDFHRRVDGACSVTLLEGEARVVTQENDRITLRLPAGELELRRAAARLRRQGDAMRLAVERGAAMFAFAGASHTLDGAGEWSLNAQGASPAVPSAWTIRATDYQLASAQSLRPYCPPCPRSCPIPYLPPEMRSDEREQGEDQEDFREDDQDTTTQQVPPEQQQAPPQPAPAPPAGEAVATTSARTNQNVGFPGGFGLGPFSGTTSTGASGADFADANQQTNQGRLTQPYQGLNAGDPFPGNIHLVTSESRYSFNNVELTPQEQQRLFPNGPTAYYSIGVGPPPTGQVDTDFVTGTDPNPTVIPVRGFDAYVVRLDQYGIPDPTLDPQAGLDNNIGIAGLVGETPEAPEIRGAAPLIDQRAVINDRATFALGEFRIDQENGRLRLSIRRSDQDRRIVKDPNGNDANDLVTVNPDVSEFLDVPDPRFQPQAPTVRVPAPGAFSNRGTQFSTLDLTRRAAVTTLMADQFYDYARRTGQTRFVLEDAGGVRILDISGYRRP